MNRQTIAVFSSHVMRGAVGNRAMVPFLEGTGFCVWAVPTITMPFHPGHGRSTIMRPPAEAFDAAVDDLANLLAHQRVDGLISGYLGNAGQAKAIARFVTAAKSANPDCLYLCDPVCGDAGRLYVPEETASAIRDCLLPLADITTPNSFEHAWMMGSGERTTLAPETVITGIACDDASRIGTRLLLEGRVVEQSHARLPGAPNGTGDLFAAAYASARLRGKRAEEAMASAVATVLAVLEVTQCAGSDDLVIQSPYAPTLREPS